MQVVKSYPNNMFCWVDLATSDVPAAKEFYNGLFGWDYLDMPTPEGSHYSLCQIEGYNVAGLSNLPAEMMAQNIPPIWSSYIKHDDVDAVIAKATAAGGTLAMEPMDVMESGRLGVLQDPTGAMVSLWQPKHHIGAQLVNMPNAWVWSELQTKDAETASKFYQTVFGWGRDQDPNGYHLFKLGERMQAGMLQMDESWGEVPPNWGVYFMSEDIEATAARAKELGGAIYVPPTDTGTVGHFAVIGDPQGGAFTAIQYYAPVDPPPGY